MGRKRRPTRGKRYVKRQHGGGVPAIIGKAALGVLAPIILPKLYKKLRGK